MIQELNSKQNVDIATIQTDVRWLKKEIIDIKDNHLNSIYKEIRTIKGWVITSLLTILTALGVYVITN